MKGFGFSDKPDGDYSQWGLADFLKDFLDTLKIKTIHIVGTDIGLTIAAAFAVRYPKHLHSLILMAGSANKRSLGIDVRLLKMKILGDLLMHACSPLVVRIGMQKGFYRRPQISPEILKEYTAAYRSREGRCRTLETIRSFKTDDHFGEHLRKISVPTLILWAENERFFFKSAASHLQKTIPGAKLIIVPRSGHFIQEDQPEESSRMIMKFLKEEAERSSK